MTTTYDQIMTGLSRLQGSKCPAHGHYIHYVASSGMPREVGGYYECPRLDCMISVLRNEDSSNTLYFEVVKGPNVFMGLRTNMSPLELLAIAGTE